MLTLNKVTCNLNNKAITALLKLNDAQKGAAVAVMVRKWSWVAVQLVCNAFVCCFRILYIAAYSALEGVGFSQFSVSNSKHAYSTVSI